MDNIQKEYLEIVNKGTISEIVNFTVGHFHEIKHVDSFYAMINRLYDMETLLDEIKEKTRKFAFEIVSEERRIK